MENFRVKFCLLSLIKLEKGNRRERKKIINLASLVSSLSSRPGVSSESQLPHLSSALHPSEPALNIACIMTHWDHPLVSLLKKYQ